MRKDLHAKTDEIEAVRQQLNAAVSRHACLLDPEILHLSCSLDLLLNRYSNKNSGVSRPMASGHTPIP